MLEVFSQDLRFAVRSLLKRPLITAVAVLSLALGIGVNTAIFSVFDRLLLRRLPVPAPEEIVHVTSPGPRPGFQSTGDSGGTEHIFSYPLFRDLERLENTGLTRIAAHEGFAVNLSRGGQTAVADGLLVSGGYFPMLGVQPAAGRLLTPDDDRVLGGHPVVVLAHRFWMTRFGGNRDVVGGAAIVNGQPMTIVGVAAAGFTGETTTNPVDMFVPLAMAGSLTRHTLERNDHWLYVTGRLAPAFTREQAQAAMNVLFTPIIREVEFPAQRRGLDTRAREAFLARRIVLEDGARGRYANRSEARLIVGLLLSVTGLVLLIACANLANLMLARAIDRTSEIGIRLSMGATARRVIRLLMTEALLLGLLGGAAALIIARVAVGAMLTTMPPDDAARLPFELNRTILLFTLALSLGTSVIFGLVPAAHTLRRVVGRQATQPGRASDSRSTARLRTGLATAQIALATALLAQAGLFVTSLVNVARVELGIRREGLLSFRLTPGLSGYTPERTLALLERVEAELRTAPGVVAATATTIPILSDNRSSNNVTVEGFKAEPDANTVVSSARIGDDYFRTLGIPLLAGRAFTAADRSDAAKVAVVNEAFARKFNLGTAAVGKRMATGAGDNKPLDIEIVGLVRDARYSDVKDPPPPQLYLPYRQSAVGGLTFYARSASDARQLRSTVQALVARVDPNLPIERLRTMDEQIWDNVTTERILATLSSWFAGLATLLAAIGLYAVLAYTVAQRVREIGIRMALGARAVDVWRLVFSQVGRIGIIGGIIGIAAAVALARLGEALLFGVQGTNVGVLAAAAGAITVIALAAGAFPARRASRIAPVVALRTE